MAKHVCVWRICKKYMCMKVNMSRSGLLSLSTEEPTLPEPVCVKFAFQTPNANLNAQGLTKNLSTDGNEFVNFPKPDEGVSLGSGAWGTVNHLSKAVLEIVVYHLKQHVENYLKYKKDKQVSIRNQTTIDMFLSALAKEHKIDIDKLIRNVHTVDKTNSFILDLINICNILLCINLTVHLQPYPPPLNVTSTITTSQKPSMVIKQFLKGKGARPEIEMIESYATEITQMMLLHGIQHTILDSKYVACIHNGVKFPIYSKFDCSICSIKANESFDFTAFDNVIVSYHMDIYTSLTKSLFTFLKTINEKGIIHGDIKLHNILVRQTPELEFAVGDFSSVQQNPKMLICPSRNFVCPLVNKLLVVNMLDLPPESIIFAAFEDVIELNERKGEYGLKYPRNGYEIVERFMKYPDDVFISRYNVFSYVFIRYLFKIIFNDDAVKEYFENNFDMIEARKVKFAMMAFDLGVELSTQMNYTTMVDIFLKSDACTLFDFYHLTKDSEFQESKTYTFLESIKFTWLERTQNTPADTFSIRITCKLSEEKEHTIVVSVSRHESTQFVVSVISNAPIEQSPQIPANPRKSPQVQPSQNAVSQRPLVTELEEIYRYLEERHCIFSDECKQEIQEDKIRSRLSNTAFVLQDTPTFKQHLRYISEFDRERRINILLANDMYAACMSMYRFCLHLEKQLLKKEEMKLQVEKEKQIYFDSITQPKKLLGINESRQSGSGITTRIKETTSSKATQPNVSFMSIITSLYQSKIPSSQTQPLVGTTKPIQYNVPKSQMTLPSSQVPRTIYTNPAIQTRMITPDDEPPNFTFRLTKETNVVNTDNVCVVHETTHNDDYMKRQLNQPMTQVQWKTLVNNIKENKQPTSTYYKSVTELPCLVSKLVKLVSSKPSNAMPIPNPSPNGRIKNAKSPNPNISEDIKTILERILTVLHGDYSSEINVGNAVNDLLKIEFLEDKAKHMQQIREVLYKHGIVVDYYKGFNSTKPEDYDELEKVIEAYNKEREKNEEADKNEKEATSAQGQPGGKRKKSSAATKKVTYLKHKRHLTVRKDDEGRAFIRFNGEVLYLKDIRGKYRLVK